jgi:hypothetical protein
MHQTSWIWHPTGGKADFFKTGIFKSLNFQEQDFPGVKSDGAGE